MAAEGEVARTRRRIDLLRAGGLGGSGAPHAPRVEPGSQAPPGQRTAQAEAASGALRDERFADWRREGEFLYRRRQLFRGRGVAVWPDRFSPEACSAEELVFYDTETTGLSGGAGSVIFLFGAAWCEGPDLAVEQLFLSDFPGEPEFLLAVRELLRPYRAFISYNGATFDRHVLSSRFRMNRIPWTPGPQVDLVHHARRLWRSVLGNCSLRSVEAGVLGFRREMDVAGEDIPLVWLEFARTGRPGALPLVFDHNTLDVVSLARLYGLIGGFLDGGRPVVGVDERALGTWLIRRGDSAGVEVLEEAFRRGDAQAGISLALHLKRRREWENAAAVWERLLEESRSLVAAIELAKHHEHRTHRYDLALSLVERAVSWNLPLEPQSRQEIRKRRERLQRKLSRKE